MEFTSSTQVSSADEISMKHVYSTPNFKVYGSITMLTMGNNGTRCDGSGPASGPSSVAKVGNTCPSDPSLKENISRVGTHPLGFGLYLFDYKSEYCPTFGHGRQFGVMADEVSSVRPDAVVTHPDGYLMVNYGLLGITRTVH